MQFLRRIGFRSSCERGLPLQERLSVQAVRRNFSKLPLTHRFYNNFRIGLNYLSTVAQYSKCYLCKLPPAKTLIRNANQMQSLDSTIHQANQTLYAALPPGLQTLKTLANYFHYPQQNFYSAVGLALGQAQNQQAQVNYLGAIEAVTMGYELHNAIGGSFNPNLIVRIGLTLLRKIVKDKYLILAGDYLHIRGSVLASASGHIELPKTLAQLEVALSKQAYYREQIQRQVEEKGYESVTVEQIHEVSKLRASKTVHSLKGIALLRGEQPSEELFEQIGLMVLYRRELQEFMFNFPRLLGRYLRIKMVSGAVGEAHSLPQYLFYRSCQGADLRLDLAYLNTVQLMTRQIEILQCKVRRQLGKDYEAFEKKLRYTLTMY